ncbi:hypothetical protein DB32_006344 [Sandaracinus amylolyticus]|uniref:Uncharacterized protein n=1 Tax=Sandaracinus amylolyticus TaxID=927083 RepID=A0A0F6YKX3_9BACT|nr:hypothetical protein DB32_006344 [Sandaracinus amylolyticus]
MHDAEVRLARLKSLYEQYFQGIEKLEPAIPRKELERVLDILRKNQPRNTALRFRTQMLIAKYGTYVTYWQRIARQIEEGTYRRDVVRAQQRRHRDEARKKRTKDGEAETPGAWELDVDVDEVEDLRNFSFDDSDVDAILGALGPSAREPSVPPPARRLSPFGSSMPPRPSAPPDALRAPLPASPPLSAPKPAIAPKPATATFAKPVSATFGKPGTATFAKPVAGAPAAPSAPLRHADAPPGSAPRAIPQLPQRPAAAVPRPPAPPPPPRPPVAASREGLDDANMRSLYDRYVEARRRNNERVDNVRYETLAQSVQQMLPKLREKHGDRKIDFDIVVQNGKVGLKPKLG